MAEKATKILATVGEFKIGKDAGSNACREHLAGLRYFDRPDRDLARPLPNVANDGDRLRAGASRAKIEYQIKRSGNT